MTGPEDDARRDSGASSDDASEGGEPAEQARAREDAAWEAIVAHYGERPDAAALDDLAARPADEADGATGATGTAEVPEVAAHAAPAARDPEDRYVPPTPPPVPWPTRWRAVAWGGVFGAPALLLLVVVAGIDLPEVLDYLLVAWFIGGFLGLVITMREGPRDPWDDGSRV